jgi:hypothetical protein
MREQGRAVFTTVERFVFGAILMAAIIGVYGLVSGAITI